MRFSLKVGTQRRGFTLIEILVVVVIVSILATITLVGFVNMKQEYQLDFATKEVRQMFELARSHSLASSNDSEHGVAVFADEIVLFAGTSYDPSDADNQEFELPAMLEIVNTDFGGSTEMYFLKGTGEASEAGELEVRLVSEPGRSNTVTVSKTGIISSEE